MVQLKTVLSKFYEEYQNHTPKKLKLIDSYLVYVLLTGILQFAYCTLVGTFPFNSFLSGFISTISCFVLGGELLYQFKMIKKLIFLFTFQSASDSNRTPKIKANFKEYLPREVSQISSLLILFFTLSSSTLSVKLV